MYYYSKNSRRKVIHDGDCFCIQNVDGDSIGIFKTLDEAYAHGYRLCRHCSPISIHYRKEIAEITAYCSQHAVSFFFCDKFIRVKAAHSKWKIVPADGKKGFLLYHKNTYKSEHDDESPIPGYHLQRVSKATVLGFIKYIVEHEAYRMGNPVYIRPPKREPPRKGSKRYKKQQAKAEQYARKQAIINVLNLIDNLSNPASSSYRAAAI